ncbi:CPBP family intramembrane metalloprotease [Duganella sp. FT135W]|uniref:CPBP family intramembrane metalloprotease n=1 Tax=Duganella flavida TaxID=2692175 RepID=A0A6L8KA64_9BURK|nr:CPBP family intramembrane glutamic endopeptidase [Duganella flavida]MYM24343.1 CPBP family intramembrane metalloprotease [Duganella flavida]
MIALALAFYLVFILPGRHLWRSVRPDDAPKPALTQRYLLSIRDIGLTLLVLLAICWWNGYSAADMGLAAPTSGAPLWYLVAAVVAMTALLAGSAIQSARMTPEKVTEALDKGRDTGMPADADELRLFAILVLSLGAGWELLYRGFLLLVLTPYIGTWGAVAVSGLTYGAAHGYKNPRQFTLSVVSALLFAAGYALSGSLWWLMVIHIGMPLSGAVSMIQLRRRELQLASSAD